ncbi:hypothetical protein CLOM_g19603 [Closterium sp. NIES-68]|nr:hypothetical protein CLOM_g19603 [Closterium sp. NIES-68]GJP68871.1 hypothetical protein CLOP_g25519 [Closterium sp. NIES-67]
MRENLFGAALLLLHVPQRFRLAKRWAARVPAVPAFPGSRDQGGVFTGTAEAEFPRAAEALLVAAAEERRGERRECVPGINAETSKHWICGEIPIEKVEFPGCEDRSEASVLDSCYGGALAAELSLGGLGGAGVVGGRGGGGQPVDSRSTGIRVSNPPLSSSSSSSQASWSSHSSPVAMMLQSQMGRIACAYHPGGSPSPAESRSPAGASSLRVSPGMRDQLQFRVAQSQSLLLRQSLQQSRGMSSAARATGPVASQSSAAAAAAGHMGGGVGGGPGGGSGGAGVAGAVAGPAAGIAETAGGAVIADAPPVIHPNAVVHPDAVIREGVEIGPFCTVGPHVTIGRGCKLLPGCHVAGNTVIGEFCTLMSGAVVGADLPGTTVIGSHNSIGYHATVGVKCQDLKYKEGSECFLVLGSHNDIREHSQIHRSSMPDDATLVGDNNLIMGSCHVAHDCKMGNRNILANGTLLGGHVVLHDFVHTGGAVAVHQFCHIGSYSFLAGGSMVVRDVPTYTMVAGDRAELRGLNLEGLRRCGFSTDQVRNIRRAYQQLFFSVDASSGLEDRLDQLEASELMGDANVATLLTSVRASFGEGRRGICKFRHWSSVE